MFVLIVAYPRQTLVLYCKNDKKASRQATSEERRLLLKSKIQVLYIHDTWITWSDTATYWHEIFMQAHA